jgi:glycosyltransferase involved in cell wall biosynthesis
MLCLIGSGPLRDGLKERIRGLEDVVRIFDPAAHSEVPRWLRAFDVCLLLATSGPYHYSPLKLYEYLGCGRPVIAPRIGEMARVLADGRDAVLVRPGNPPEVVDAVAKLAGEPQFRAGMGRRGRLTAERIGSWQARADTIIDAVEERGLLSRHNRSATSHG